MQIEDLDLSEADWRVVERAAVQLRGFRGFVDDWWPHVEPAALRAASYVDTMCRELERVARYEIRGLVINVPPAMGKTTIAQVLWPAWVWATIDPTRRFLFASYARGVLWRYGNKFLRLVSSDEWRAMYPDAYVRPDSPVLDHENISGGTRFAWTTGATSIGRHGHHWLGDDLIDPIDATGRRGVNSLAIADAREWIANIVPRSILPGGNRTYVGQRLHDEDPTDALLAPGIVHVRLPMVAEHPSMPCPVRTPHDCVPDVRPEGALLAPEYIDAETLRLMQTDTSPAAIAAQYQQRPSPLAGGLYQRAWMERYYETLPHAQPGMRWCMFWDLAFRDGPTNDYVVGQLWLALGADRYLVDQVRDRMSYVDTKAAVRSFVAKWLGQIGQPFGIHVEGKANGDALISDLQHEIPGIQSWPPQGTKFPAKHERWTAVTTYWAAGNVLLPRPDRAPWVHDFREEHAAAGAGGAHDDQVDASSGALLVLGSGGGYEDFRKQSRSLASNLRARARFR